MNAPRSAEESPDDWLDRFHRGDRSVLAACYRDHYDAVNAAIGSILSDADRETAIHEVFYRMISGAHVRRAFRGGSFVRWLTTVARNHAIDVHRRRRREHELTRERAESLDEAHAGDHHVNVLVRELRERLRDELPVDWLAVFEARFVRQLSQREAARLLGIRRTTLAYREQRVRRILRRYALEEDS